nr:hypothetical protein [uncultured bacterium]
MGESTAKAVLSPPSVPFFRTAQYVVEVEGPKGLVVPNLDLARDLKGVEVTMSSPESEPVDADRERVRVSFTLDANEPGEYKLPKRTLDLGNGEKAELPGLTLTVREASEEEVQQAGAFVDIGDPALVAPPRSHVWFYAGAGLLALAAIAGGIWYWQTHQKVEVWTPPALKPWEVAHNRLEELASRRLPHQGRYEPYYVDLTAILRYYIEDRFHLHAPDRTTPEFLDEASRSGVISEAQQVLLAQFLRHCDRVKFAQYEPTFEEMESGIEVVKRFVLETTPVPAAVEPIKEAA